MVKTIYRLRDLTINNRYISRAMRESIVSDCDDCIDWIKRQNKKKLRKRTIRKNINIKGLNYYVTITLNRSWKDATDLGRLQSALKKIFYRNGIDYFLVPELHADGVNYHFHGFLGVASGSDMMVDSGHKDRFGNKVYHMRILAANYGFNTCVCIAEKKEWVRSKIINYVAKYMVQSGVKAMSNRPKYSNIVRYAIDMFGVEFVRVIK